MNNTNYRQIIDLIKYPIITDKATRLLEINQYTFATDIKANKEQIKLAIEYLFQVKVNKMLSYFKLLVIIRICDKTKDL